MSYWNESVAEQIKKLRADNPKLTYKQAKSIVTGGSNRHLYGTNPVRTRFSGANEIARRKSQIERGIIKVNG